MCNCIRKMNSSKNLQNFFLFLLKHANFPGSKNVRPSRAAKLTSMTAMSGSMYFDVENSPKAEWGLTPQKVRNAYVAVYSLVCLCYIYFILFFFVFFVFLQSTLFSFQWFCDIYNLSHPWRLIKWPCVECSIGLDLTSLRALHQSRAQDKHHQSLPWRVSN